MNPALVPLLPLRAFAADLGLAGAAFSIAAQAATPAELASGHSAQAGQGASPARGQQFFTTGHGREWSCAACHNQADKGDFNEHSIRIPR